MATRAGKHAEIGSIRIAMTWPVSMVATAMPFRESAMKSHGTVPPLFQPRPLAAALALLCAGIALPLRAQTSDDKQAATTLPEVTATTTDAPQAPTEKTKSYTVRKSASATKLDMSLRDTPQSVTVVTRAQMDDFGLNSVNDVLDQTAGVVVEKVETDRTYYTSRGFDITNFQVDGVGMPFAFGLVDGDMDTAIYDRVEVVRGANSLMTGTGNPSAAVNFVRKRPTRDFQASAGLTYGSWNDKRIDADLSGPLVEAGTVRGRVTYAAEKSDSYLDRYSKNKTIFNGSLAADLGKSSLLTVGYTQQRNRSHSPMWGALPLYYTDGSATHYDVSTSTSADWAYWDSRTDTAYAELQHFFDNGWETKASYSHTRHSETSELLYVYGTPDKSTGLGLAAYPSAYEYQNKQELLDVSARGPFSFAGRQHELVVGANVGRSRNDEMSGYSSAIGDPIPDISDWDGNFPKPDFDASIDGGTITDNYRTFYGAARFSVSDELKLISGLTVANVDSSGYAYGEDKARANTGTSPYLGAVYTLSPNWSAFGSYTAIFNPQYQADANRQRLDPAKGHAYEAGLKGEFLDRALNATLSVFKSRQNNLADSAGTRNDGSTYYTGIDTRSQGVELELAGKLTRRLELNGGYTLLSIKDDGGKDVRTFTPRQLFKLATTYQLPWMEKLKLGAELSWRDKTWLDQGGGIVIRQGSYALLDLMAKYTFSDTLSTTLKLNNVTDKKYLTSIYWSQGYYGAPMNVSLALNWKY